MEPYIPGLCKVLYVWDFPYGPLAKNLPSNAGDTGLIPGWGTKPAHTMGHLSLCCNDGALALQQSHSGSKTNKTSALCKITLHSLHNPIRWVSLSHTLFQVGIEKLSL